MPSYKFTYFNLRGRGELTRLVFTAAGQKFEDYRLKDGEWPGTIKDQTPFGQLPMLTVDGKFTLAQSNSIARYLAREFGLLGKTNMDAGMCDQYMELVEDLFKELIKSFFEKDEAKKAELEKKLQEEVLPKFLGIFEKGLAQNKSGFFVGDKLTLADLAVYNGFTTPLQNYPSMLEKFPKMQDLMNKVGSVPNIKEYVAKRAKTEI